MVTIPKLGSQWKMSFLFRAGGRVTEKQVEQELKQVDQNLRPNHIILLTVLNAQYPIDIQIISKVTQPIGKVLRIVVFKRGAIVQSMVEFEDIQTATSAKDQLHGCDIYTESCTLKVEFARTERLNVKRNDDMTWDYTDEFAQHQGSFGGSGQQRGEDRGDHGGKIGLVTTTGGKPVLEIEIVQHEMRLVVLPLEIEDGRAEIESAAIIVFPVPVWIWSEEEITHEITHEREEEGKYTLALSVGDQEVARVNVDSLILRNLTDIKIDRYFIKDVVVLDKP